MATVDPRRLQYEQWVRTYAPDLYRFAYRLMGKHQAAEDLLQETFVEARRAMATLNDPHRARAWLFQILRFRYAHHLRDRNHRLQPSALPNDASEQLVEGTASPVGQALEQRESLQLALDTLSPEIRETFLMVALEGLRCRDVAESLGVPVGTILSRLSRARAALKEAMHRSGKYDATPPARATPQPREAGNQ